MSDDLVARARALAERAHDGHQRKAGGLPYLTHLEAVARLLEEHGYRDPVMLAAAYLHDLVEDRPAFEPELRASMPAEVVATVEALTEPKLDADGRKKPKSERFEAYVTGLGLPTEAARRALPVSCADKIHNLTSLVDAERGGDPLLMRLTTRPGEQRAQLRRVRALYDGAVAPSLLAAFDTAERRLEQLFERWLPGRAALIAAEAHLGQVDRAGMPYVLHPMHLAVQARTMDERVVALLHDVIEDTSWTLAALEREGFSPAVVRAIEALTRRKTETYEEFVERVAEDRLATRVKLLDLSHNSDLSRLPSPTDEDRARVEKYRRATTRLEAELRRRDLRVRLDEASRERARSLSTLPVPKADHVTLARRVEPEGADPAWVPGGHAVGDTVSLRAVAACATDRVQAWVVELGGTTSRPFDGGTLHLTVSRARDARSRDANDALRAASREPLDVALSGVIEWVDD